MFLALCFGWAFGQENIPGEHTDSFPGGNGDSMHLGITFRPAET